MRRRVLLIFLGSGLAFSRVASAREQDRVRRIGLLMASAESDPDGQARVKAFRDALQDLGWVEGRNLQLDNGGPQVARTVSGPMRLSWSR